MTLADLYRRIPKIDCQGFCEESCGPIVVGSKEAAAMKAAAGGKPLTVSGEATCGYLKGGRCSVYKARPFICRMWGVVPELPCPWGCHAERILTRAEATMLFRMLERVGGKRVMPKVEE